MIVLSGDVGGTNARLALYRHEGGRLLPLREASFASARFGSLEAVLAEFLPGLPRADRACIAVAGPVLGGRCRLTNLGWEADEASLAAAAAVPALRLVNDLQAMAYAVPHLPPASVERLRGGEGDPEGVVAVLAAGTGLGASFLVRNGGRAFPFATEGGHVDFAPRDDRESNLLFHLRRRFGRVSNERVLSGPGLFSLYRFVVEEEDGVPCPAVEAVPPEEAPPEVVRAALDGSCRSCASAVGLFASLYGAAAGNLALVLLATGGVVLGGGLSPALLPFLRAGGPFEASFLDKGRFREILEPIPLSVILDDRASLHGAARFAAAAEGK
jgi:glucokinase